MIQNYQQNAPSKKELDKLIGFVVLEFGTSWCTHCKAASPLIASALENKKLTYIKIEDGKGKALGRSFKVTLWPTLVLLQSGIEIIRLVRPGTDSELDEFLSFID